MEFKCDMCWDNCTGNPDNHSFIFSKIINLDYAIDNNLLNLIPNIICINCELMCNQSFLFLGTHAKLQKTKFYFII